MVAWGAAPANVAFRRPVAKERASIELSPRRQCIVAIAAGGGTWTCVLGSSGAYWCPPLHEPTGPQLKRNARIDKRGVLVLDQPPRGTHPTPPLAWQRYPHVDGFVEPWTAGGTLRPGLRFKGEGRGGCVVVDETALFAISCLTPDLRRYEACFPQWQNWQPGDVAACGRLGDTSFLRWTITGPNAGAQELRTCADRWNQGNMVGWGPTPASVGVARRRVRGQLQAAEGEPLPRLSRSRPPGFLLEAIADVRLRDGAPRGVRLPAECRRLAAAEEAERHSRCARHPDAPRLTPRHARDAAARVAPIPACGRLRRALDVQRNAPRGPPLQGFGTGSLLCHRRDGDLRDQLPRPYRPALQRVLPAVEALASG